MTARAAFLAEAGAVLAGSLEYATTLTSAWDLLEVIRSSPALQSSASADGDGTIVAPTATLTPGD